MYEETDAKKSLIRSMRRRPALTMLGWVPDAGRSNLAPAAAAAEAQMGLYEVNARGDAGDQIESRPLGSAATFVHTVAVAALAGAVAGIIAGGLCGRLAMRVTAIMATSAEQGTLTEAEERVGEISVGGTIALIVFGGMLAGIIGGFVYAACEHWFRGFGPWRGVAFGIFLLATLGWAVIEGDNFDFSSLGAVSVNLIMFSAIYLLFGVLLVPFFDWTREHLPRPALRPSFFAVVPVYAIGLLFSTVLLIAIVGIGRSEDGREAPFFSIVPAYLVFGMAIAGTLIARNAGRFDRLADLRKHGSAMTAALAVIVLPLVAGLALDAQALTEMLTAAY
jgi:MFS family permease